MTSTQIIAIVIFLVTMAAIMTEKLHRTVAAVAGALLLILTGVLSVESGFSYVDLNTLGVLIGMMLFVAVVKNSGIFEYIAIKAAKIAKGRPWPLMVLFALITAVLSAFLDNVTTVLLIGPMTLAITSMLRINPIPFFMTQIMASNIGGTATLIGDPPNIMIGSAAGLSFTDFITNTGVAVLFVLAATIVCFYFIYGRKLHVEPEAMDSILQLDENKAIKDRSLLIKSVVMILLVVFGFVFHSQLHLESCTIALPAAAVMLLIGRQDVEEIVAGVDRDTEAKSGYPVYDSLAQCPKADVIIDFSVAKAADGLISYCEETKIPLVLCTTGLSEDQLLRVNKLSETSAVLRSANMSVGINLLIKVLKEISPVLAAAGFDIEILEKHHNRKLDAPSGTALALADAINESLHNEYHYQYDRTAQRQKRDPKEIGIQAMRGGTIVGEHDIMFAGRDEVITLQHTAFSREIFAKGAVEAAKFLAGKPAGMYDMSDVIG